MKLYVWENCLLYEGFVCVYAKDESRAWDLLKNHDKIACKLLRAKRQNPREITDEECFVVWSV